MIDGEAVPIFEDIEESTNSTVQENGPQNQEANEFIQAVLQSLLENRSRSIPLLPSMKSALNSSRPALCENMKLDHLINQLRAKIAITGYDIQEINAETISYKRNNKFLDWLETHDTAAFHEFIGCLYQTGQAHLARQIIEKWAPNGVSADILQWNYEDATIKELKNNLRKAKRLRQKNSAASCKKCRRSYIVAASAILFAVIATVASTLYSIFHTNNDPGLTTTPPSHPTTAWPPSNNMTDCYDYLKYKNVSKSDVMFIYPQPGIKPFYVYCDMETDGGGWTVIERRIDPSLSFWNNTYNEYKEGFNNNLKHNFWLGLEYVHILSSKDKNVDLRIDMEVEENGQKMWGKWPNFRVADEGSQYELSFGEMIAGNLDMTKNGYFYTNHNGGVFLTSAASAQKCVSPKLDSKLGPFWYKMPDAWDGKCGTAHLNGAYHTDQEPLAVYEGLSWRSSDGWINAFHIKLEMKLRRRI